MTINRIRLGMFCLAIVGLMVCLASVAGHAQSYTEGSIAGTVFDPSGAVVPGATITIHNDGTNAENHLTSDASGYFKAPQLPAAIYTVSVSAPGLLRLERSTLLCRSALQRMSRLTCRPGYNSNG